VEDDVYDEPGCEALHETEKALLVKCADGDVWIPKSAIHEDSEVFCLDPHNGQFGKLVIHGWFARKKDWL